MSTHGTAPRIARHLLLVLLASSPLACVQPAYDHVVIYRVDVSAVPNVSAVGLRGSTEPLSWGNDFSLAPRPDSAGLYEAIVTQRTGSRVTEVKFTANGGFELVGRENRKVRFARPDAGNDTTVFRVVFNVP
jgi:hypothetical protein